MLYVPSIFGENLMDDFMDDFGFGFDDSFFGRKNPLYGKHAKNMMKTDVRETDGTYELDIDLPGFKKDDVQAELKDGYLTINAQTQGESEDKDEQGTYVRKERFSGKCSRTFYVGDDVEEDDIKAKFEDGVLKIAVPKKQEQPKLEEKKTIAIEG